MKTAIERFMAKVKKTPRGCWEWTGSCFFSGYGAFWFDGRNHPANRISYLFHIGKIPKNLFVLHKCDNRKCVNPDHLWLGSKKDNAQDAMEKGRATCQNYSFLPKGENHPSAKLDENKVREARRSNDNGVSIKHLAKKYGVTYPTMREAIHKVTWKEV